MAVSISIETELHTGPAAELLEPWTRLQAGQPTATPFTGPGWGTAWDPHFGADATPFSVVARAGGEVVGLALLVLRRRGPFRILEPVGMEPGDYWDVLAAPGLRGEVADAVARALVAHGDRWDAWILRCLPPDSPLEAALDASALPSLIRPRIPAPSIELPSDFDEYLRSLSSNRRQNLRRHLRRLDEGEVQLRDVTDTAELPEAIDRWQDFRRRQWDAAEREINPVHLAAHFAGFIGDACAALIPEGQAQMWEFVREDQVIGAYVNFADSDAYHWYLGGFDPEFAALGLGKIAIGHGIRTSIALGRRRYDFGRGAEPYKYWYGAEDRMLAARVVGSGRLRSRAALTAAWAEVKRRG